LANDNKKKSRKNYMKLGNFGEMHVFCGQSQVPLAIICGQQKIEVAHRGPFKMYESSRRPSKYIKQLASYLTPNNACRPRVM
jgi:hypothetical protein